MLKIELQDTARFYNNGSDVRGNKIVLLWSSEEGITNAKELQASRLRDLKIAFFKESEKMWSNKLSYTEYQLSQDILEEIKQEEDLIRKWQV